MMPASRAARHRFTPDWSAATIDERKVLYKFVRRAVVRDAIAWEELYSLAGIKGSTGTGYEDNFRHGTISRQNAALIYRWFVGYAPESAPDLHGELLALRAQESRESWTLFLSTCGTFENVGIHIVPKGPLGIVGFALAEPVHDQPIYLGERFIFRITCSASRTVLCLQCYDDNWYILPLSRSNYWVRLPAGTHNLPSDKSDGTPDPLSEETHTGLHRFVLLLTDTLNIDQLCNKLTVGSPIASETLNEIAGTILDLKEGDWDVLRVNAHFVSKGAVGQS